MLLMMAKTKWHIIALFLGPFFAKSLVKHFVCASLCFVFVSLRLSDNCGYGWDKRGKRNGRRASVVFSSLLSTYSSFVFILFFLLSAGSSSLLDSEGALCVNQSQLSSKLADHVHAQNIIIAIPITITITIT